MTSKVKITKDGNDLYRIKQYANKFFYLNVSIKTINDWYQNKTNRYSKEIIEELYKLNGEK